MYTGAVPHIESPSFAGHETFPFRYTWLRKAVDFLYGADPAASGGADGALSGPPRNPEAFGREDAMVELGVGKNMVRSMRHWALACGVVVEVEGTRGRSLDVTNFGRALFGRWDPFLEDHASLWLLHAKLVSTPEWATTWYWVFNHLPQPEFSKGDLAKWLLAFVGARQWSRVAETSIRRDIDCFVRTYVPAASGRKAAGEDTLDCPLVDLDLIREFGATGQFIVNRGPQPTLPDELVAWSVAEFLQRHDVGTGTISLEKVAFASGAPGRVFCLTEDALVARLERLSAVTRGALAFDDTAGLRQIFVHKPLRPMEFLDWYYMNPPGGAARTAR